MKQWIILNSKGLVIGGANANSKEFAIREWNRRNLASKDVAVDAYCKDDSGTADSSAVVE